MNYSKGKNKTKHLGDNMNLKSSGRGGLSRSVTAAGNTNTRGSVNALTVADRMRENALYSVMSAN